MLIINQRRHLRDIKQIIECQNYNKEEFEIQRGPLIYDRLKNIFRIFEI